MKIIREIENIVKEKDLYPVVALGNFDGVHLGHQAILRKVKAIADEKQGKGMVFTFDPHPVKVLSPESGLHLLTTFEEKMRLISNTGIDEVICVDFSEKFSGLDPFEFAKGILHEKISAEEIVIGQGYRFGRNKSGGVNELKMMGKDLGFIVHDLPPVTLDGLVVSSSRIRRLLHKGDLKEVSRMLGRRYSVEGEIIEGAKRGRGLGFPTANISPPDRLLPADGVYATFADIDDKRFEGICYIGTQPTLGKRERNIEVHIFDFNSEGSDLYRKRINVIFIERIREEIVFKDRESLISQIKEDIDKTKEILREVVIN